MRFLCLHGKGTSAKIFESQTQSFRRLLPSHYEYEFVDGEVAMSTYKEISDFYPGPYLCYHSVNTMDVVEDCCRYIMEIVEDEGPFDGVMGFSQGCALAASLILYHQIHHPLSSPLFRFAIFICGGAPFSYTPTHGADVTSLYLQNGLMHGDIVTNSSSAQAIEQSQSTTPTPESAFSTTVRRFNAKVDEVRLQIPTGHVYGAQDVDLGKSLELVALCEERVRYTFLHQGGHNVPLGEETSRGIAKVVRDVVARSEILC